MTAAYDTDVALLKREAEQSAQIVSKLDNAIEKLTGLSNDLTKMLALHDQRIGRLEQIENEIHGLVEKRHVEVQTDIKYLDTKLAATSKEISDDLRKTEDRIVVAIKDIKTDIGKDIETISDAHDDLLGRVEALEKWRWMLVGGGTALGFVISTVMHFIK